MILQSDAVVYGRIVDGGQPRDASERDVRTVYQFKVQEIFFSAGIAVDSYEIAVIRRGGRRDRGSHIQNTFQERFPPFIPGHKYILFVKWDESASAWWSAYGADGVIDLTTGTADSSALFPVVRGINGKPEAELVKVFREGGRR